MYFIIIPAPETIYKTT